MFEINEKKANFQEALTGMPIIIKLFNTAAGKVSNLVLLYLVTAEE